MTLAEILTRWGIPFTDHGIDGYHDLPVDPAGILVHYNVGIDDTGFDSALEVAKYGHSTLTGPLYHTFIDHLDASVELITEGRANHAGWGDSDVLARARLDWEPQAPNVNDLMGNEWWFGVVLEGPPSTQDQIDRAALVCAAVCEQMGWSEYRVVGHEEWTDRKSDPDFDMVWFRSLVKGWLVALKGMADLSAEKIDWLVRNVDEGFEKDSPTSDAHVNEAYRELRTQLGMEGRTQVAVIAELLRRADAGGSDGIDMGDVEGAIEIHAGNPDAHHA